MAMRNFLSVRTLTRFVLSLYCEIEEIVLVLGDLFLLRGFCFMKILCSLMK